MNKPKKPPLEQLVAAKLQTVDDKRAVEIPLRDLLYIHETFGEFISFFHQPAKYPTLAEVQFFLGDRFSGALRLLWDCYYHKLRDVLPEDVLQKYGDGDFDVIEARLKAGTTPEEYLEIERAAEFKSEFFDGRMRMMAGASTPHNRLTRNLTRHLANALDGSSCEPFASDQRLLIEATGLFTYPDISIYCDELHYSGDKPDTLTNPAAIFEVLSPTTMDYDLAGKWEHYQQIPTLTDYVLVWQDKIQVAHYARQSPDQWLLTTFRRPTDTLALTGVTLTLSSIYAGVDFQPES